MNLYISYTSLKKYIFYSDASCVHIYICTYDILYYLYKYGCVFSLKSLGPRRLDVCNGMFDKKHISFRQRVPNGRVNDALAGVH